jgi:hypothetical protein
MLISCIGSSRPIINHRGGYGLASTAICHCSRILILWWEVATTWERVNDRDSLGLDLEKSGRLVKEQHTTLDLLSLLALSRSDTSSIVDDK